MITKIRRVVTGHHEQGQSIFVIDDIATSVQEMRSMPGLVLTDISEALSAPADNTGVADAAARPVRLEPSGSGSVLRNCEFPPDSTWKSAATDSATAFSSIGAGDGLIQRRTMHSWSVRGNEPCIVAGILIGAKPHS